MSGLSVQEAADGLTREEWSRVVTCGDFLDRLPCQQCGATRLRDCAWTKVEPAAKTRAAVEYINGYGWAAARRRAVQS